MSTSPSTAAYRLRFGTHASTPHAPLYRLASTLADFQGSGDTTQQATRSARSLRRQPILKLHNPINRNRNNRQQPIRIQARTNITNHERRNPVQKVEVQQIEPDPQRTPPIHEFTQHATQRRQLLIRSSQLTRNKLRHRTPPQPSAPAERPHADEPPTPQHAPNPQQAGQKSYEPTQTPQSLHDAEQSPQDPHPEPPSNRTKPDTHQTGECSAPAESHETADTHAPAPTTHQVYPANDPEQPPKQHPWTENQRSPARSPRPPHPPCGE